MEILGWELDKSISHFIAGAKNRAGEATFNKVSIKAKIFNKEKRVYGKGGETISNAQIYVVAEVLEEDIFFLDKTEELTPPDLSFNIKKLEHLDDGDGSKKGYKVYL